MSARNDEDPAGSEHSETRNRHEMVSSGLTGCNGIGNDHNGTLPRVDRPKRQIMPEQGPPKSNRAMWGNNYERPEKGAAVKNVAVAPMASRQA
jgi:hypothetical protein